MSKQYVQEITSLEVIPLRLMPRDRQGDSGWKVDDGGWTVGRMDGLWTDGYGRWMDCGQSGDKKGLTDV